jgi:hypothetical protein
MPRSSARLMVAPGPHRRHRSIQTYPYAESDRRDHESVTELTLLHHAPILSTVTSFSQYRHQPAEGAP